MWSYSGNPASSEKDKYRFLLSDTDSTSPILSDEEISYILTEHTDNIVRLKHLFEVAATIFARDCRKSLGPQTEDPTERQKYFDDKAKYYSKLVAGSSGLSLPNYSGAKVFTKGMQSNV